MVCPTWATNPVTVVIPFGPGGSTDLVARLVQKGLVQETNRPVNLVYKPGAGGIIGVQHVVEQNEVNTLLIHSSSFFINATNPNLNFDVNKKFILVAPLGYQPFVLVAKKDFVYKNIVSWPVLKHANFSLANGGTGTSSWLVCQQLASAVPNINFVHIPYSKGFSGVTADLLAGIVDLAFLPLGVVKPLLESDRVQVLAVANKQRISMLSRTPTLSELGIKKNFVNNPNYLFALRSTRSADLEQLRNTVVTVLQNRESQNLFSQHGLEYDHSVQDYNAFIEIEVNRYQNLVTEFK